MKKEVLRINHLNIRMADASILENISLCILEGEIVGFLGLTYSGKDSLVRFLCGAMPENVGKHHVYIDGKRAEKNAGLEEKVYRITASNYVIGDWTVAEYIGLVESGWLQIVWKKRYLEDKIGAFFQELDIEMDVSRKMRYLTELEKRIVDVVKARWHKKKLLIVEDEFEGMRPESICMFGKVLKRLISGEMGVIVNSHSDMVLSTLSEKYIIFKKGTIVKKCRKEYLKDGAHLEKYLLGNHTFSKKKSLDQFVLEGQSDKAKMVYRISGIPLENGKKGDFRFSKGTIVTILALNSKEKERLFMLLSGRRAIDRVSCVLNGHLYDSVEFSNYVKEKVVSVKHLGSEEEVFASMKVGENLLLPSLRKISSMEYIANSGKISRMLQQSQDSVDVSSGDFVENLGVNGLLGVTLERWYIYNPKVLILLEPFARCDVLGVSIVKSYIKKFSNRGTAVIIIKSREEYVEDISNEIISID